VAESYPSWVKPVASALADGRRQVTAFARSAPADVWSQPTEDEGWTVRDILSHLAGGNDQLLQTVLRAVTAKHPLDAGAFDVDTDAENAARVEERRGWTIEQLIAELDRDGEETQELLSRLTDADEHLRSPGSPIDLGGFLRIVEAEGHDLLHLVQMRRAVSE
jgi:uncharacterized protein (TIGR03083 family)